jgi:hypothetical protein
MSLKHCLAGRPTLREACFRADSALLRSATTGAVLLATVAIAAPTLSHSATTWTQNSFEDFSQGSMLDAGSNLYVSASGRIQMINRWDLNGDGNLDLIVPSGHPHTEKENTYIYFNRGGNIDGRSRIEIPGGGSAAGLVVDLNRDGLNDLVVVNSADSHVKEVDAWIYWGRPDGGFSARSRTALPAFNARAVAVGDFNGDSWPDLAIACEWSDGPNPDSAKKKVSLIYWNSASGFDPSRRLELPLDGETARSVAAADIDLDGRDDLLVQTPRQLHVFGSASAAFATGDASRKLPFRGNVVAVGDFDGDGAPDLAVGRPGSITVVLAEAGGFDLDRAVEIAVSDPRGLCAIDVDSDGRDDLVVANYASIGGATWTESLVFHSDKGTFDPANAVKLPTLGASWVSAGDLNGDGYPELVFSNANVTNQRDMFSYVYWNDLGKFRFGNHTQLRTAGSISNAIGDVDHDGEPDVVFFNTEGGVRDGPSETHVYWGDGTRNFSAERRLIINTHQVFGHGHADLDDDGHVDLVLTRENFIAGVPHEPSGISIHWGSEAGFTSPTDITATSAYGGVRFADLNRDGYLDILSGGHNFDPRSPGRTGIPIYWGSAGGFRRENRSVVPTENNKVRGPLLADLNRDGWLDIAAQEKPGTITIWWGSPAGYESMERTVIDLGRPDPLMYLQAADFNRDGWLDLLLPQRGPPDGTEVTSLVLFGGPAGFAPENSVELPSYVPYQNTIADLDRDGWLDIVFCSYGGEVSGNRPSLIYWGGNEGFLARLRTELPTHGSSGSLALDFDGDGWLDLFFANHRRSGSTLEPEPHRHITESMLYWGGPDGFSPDRRWDVIGRGPSGLNLRDPGNAYDRALHEDYVSAAFEIPSDEKPSAIDWSAETPHGTAVRFQVRTAATKDALDASPWVGPDGNDTWWMVPGSVPREARGKWIQYRARLLTPNAAASPCLSRVSLSFQ